MKIRWKQQQIPREILVEWDYYVYECLHIRVLNAKSQVFGDETFETNSVFDNEKFYKNNNSETDGGSDILEDVK